MRRPPPLLTTLLTLAAAQISHETFSPAQSLDALGPQALPYSPGFNPASCARPPKNNPWSKSQIATSFSDDKDQQAFVSSHNEHTIPPLSDREFPCNQSAQFLFQNAHGVIRTPEVRLDASTYYIYSWGANGQVVSTMYTRKKGQRSYQKETIGGAGGGQGRGKNGTALLYAEETRFMWMLADLQYSEEGLSGELGLFFIDVGPKGTGVVVS